MRTLSHVLESGTSWHIGCASGQSEASEPAEKRKVLELGAGGAPCSRGAGRCAGVEAELPRPLLGALCDVAPGSVF